jgi:hypothetical protein
LVVVVVVWLHRASSTLQHTNRVSFILLLCFGSISTVSHFSRITDWQGDCTRIARESTCLAGCMRSAPTRPDTASKHTHAAAAEEECQLRVFCPFPD